MTSHIVTICLPIAELATLRAWLNGELALCLSHFLMIIVLFQFYLIYWPWTLVEVVAALTLEVKDTT